MEKLLTLLLFDLTTHLTLNVSYKILNIIKYTKNNKKIVSNVWPTLLFPQVKH